MTNQTPPVSPDFATPPKELVDRAAEIVVQLRCRNAKTRTRYIDLCDAVEILAHELLAAEERGASRERERAKKACVDLGLKAWVDNGITDYAIACKACADAVAALAEKDKTP